MKTLFRYVFVSACLLLVASCTRTGDSTKQSKNLRLAFVANTAADFWKIARRGTGKADAELDDLTVEFKMPSDGTAAEQKQIVDDRLGQGVDGIDMRPR